MRLLQFRGPALLALVALTWMTGCATTGDRSQDGGGFGFSKERDDFQLLQHSADLEEDFRHEEGEELEVVWIPSQLLRPSPASQAGAVDPGL